MLKKGSLLLKELKKVFYSKQSAQKRGFTQKVVKKGNSLIKATKKNQLKEESSLKTLLKKELKGIAAWNIFIPEYAPN